MNEEIQRILAEVSKSCDFEDVDFSDINASAVDGDNALHVIVRFGDLAAAINSCCLHGSGSPTGNVSGHERRVSRNDARGKVEIVLPAIQDSCHEVVRLKTQSKAAETQIYAAAHYHGETGV